MGHYTEIYINVDLEEETPDHVINVLKAMCRHDDADMSLLDDYDSSWSYLFCSNSFYTPDTHAANLTYAKITNQWSLIGKGDIKDCSHIDSFFKWIMPRVDALEGEFIGYKRYEECDIPVIVVKNDPDSMFITPREYLP